MSYLVQCQILYISVLHVAWYSSLSSSSTIVVLWLSWS